MNLALIGVLLVLGGVFIIFAPRKGNCASAFAGAALAGAGLWILIIAAIRSF